MNVVVVGLGSMGKRRIRLLMSYEGIEHVWGVDTQEMRRQEVKEKYNINSYKSIGEMLEEHSEVDCAFVCTSPLSHHAIIQECLKNNLHVFTEINLVNDGYEESIQLAKERKKVLFLSSTFLYREEIQYIKNIVSEKQRNINYIYHVGQYLPDWHPWESYNNFFVGNKRTNGCREIMAIEFPWIVETFGEIKNIHVIHDKMSRLNIAYDDNYLIEIVHENNNKGILVVDVVCPKAVRQLEIYGEKLYLTWNGTPTGLKHFDTDKSELRDILLYKNIMHDVEYQATVIENAYANEIQEFFSVVAGQKEQRYGYEKDKEILKWIDKIEGD